VFQHKLRGIDENLFLENFWGDGGGVGIFGRGKKGKCTRRTQTLLGFSKQEQEATTPPMRVGDDEECLGRKVRRPRQRGLAPGEGNGKYNRQILT